MSSAVLKLVSSETLMKELIEAKSRALDVMIEDEKKAIARLDLTWRALSTEISNRKARVIHYESLKYKLSKGIIPTEPIETQTDEIPFDSFPVED